LSRSGNRPEVPALAPSGDGSAADERGTAELEELAPSGVDSTAYERWIAEFEERDDALIRKELSEFTIQPRISLIAPFGDASPAVLERTMQSVAAQSYGKWELCLTGRGAGHPVRQDTRIKTRWQVKDPWQAALQLAFGDYVAVLEPGGALAADALFHIVDLLNREPATDVIYSDEDCMDEAGRRARPFFKPEWSPDLILSMNYAGRLLVLRRGPVLEVGQSSHAYDLLLRVIERTSRVQHIPRVLYHATAEEPGRDHPADRQAVNDHLRSAHTGAWTETDPRNGRWRVRYPLPLDGRVSIIIPTGGKADLEGNLQSVAAGTDYPQYEVVVIDNSGGDAVRNLTREAYAGAQPIRYIDWRHKPFNYATMCNQAARTCDSPFLLFLNDDTRVITPGWLRAMVELGARPEVGAVGARLLFPDGSIQHAGVFLGLYSRAGHLFKGLDSVGSHYFGLDRVIRNVSAVTGACLLVRAELFWDIGAFDADHFPVDSNDIDLCLRIGAKGYRVLYTPYAELYHDESQSKGVVDRIAHPTEMQEFSRRWSEMIRNDKFYSPNLSRRDVGCSPRIKGD